MTQIPEHIKLGRQLLGLKDRKELVADELKEINIAIAELESKLVKSLIDSEMIDYTDAELGKKFSIRNEVNVQQSDYARENDEAFAKAFSENGYPIFKYSVNHQTLGGAVRKEIIQRDEFGAIVIPDWAKEFIDVKEYQKISIR